MPSWLTWIVKQPWAGWVVAVLLAFLWLHSPRTVTVTKTEFKERVVIKTEWRAHIAAAEGATTVIEADGRTTIFGPTVLTAEGRSDSERVTVGASSTTTRPAHATWSAGAVAVLPALSLRPAYGGTVGYRLLGPVWVEGQVVMRETLPDVGLVVRVMF